jgi:hypothetical protein
VPAGGALEAAFNVLLETGGRHLVLAPGYVVLRFVLWRPAKRVRYSSFATALAGAVVWVVGIVVLVTWWGTR